jgi:hypothetical protein
VRALVLFLAAMRRPLLLGLVAVLVLGCNLLNKKGDGADGGGDAAPEADAATPAAPAEDAAAAPAPVAITAKNAADVARFPGETPVSDDDMKLAQVAPVRTAPRTGATVATLRPNLDPHKIAEYQGSILVQFPDPKDANTTLMGWVAKEAFTILIVRDAGPKPDASAPPAADAAAPTPTPTPDAGGSKLLCAGGSAAILLGPVAMCRKKCTKDAECKGGLPGSCANATAQSGGIVQVCTTE